MNIIAEIGVNFAGSYEKAVRMVKKAKEVGATHVKFQKYNPIKVLGKNNPALPYAYQLSWQELTEISKYARSLRLLFGCSVFDVNDIVIVDRISDYHKIASRMNTNQEFIAKIDSCKKPTFMSIQPKLGVRIPDRFKLLWCVREYPTPSNVIKSYPYNATFGLSSHCSDYKAVADCITQGAHTIEVHVCESRNEEGCDISSSLTFDELARLVQMGNGNVLRTQTATMQEMSKTSLHDR